MKLEEIIYDIREKLKFDSDDIDITNGYLAHLINIKRTFLIKQRYSNFTRNIPEELKQVICLDLEVVESVSGEPCFGDILKSKESVPSSIELGGRNAILSVRVKDILYPHLNVVSIERLPYVGYNKWLKQQIYIALDADGKIYFKSDNPLHLNLESIKLTGVFSNPEDAYTMSCDSADANCDYYSATYPIEPYIIHDLINLIVRELAPGLNIPGDKISNADESNRN